MNCFYLSPQNLLHNWVLYDVDTYTMGLDYVILAYLKVVHYFYGSVSSLNILAFLSSVFTRLVNYSIEYVLDIVLYIYIIYQKYLIFIGIMIIFTSILNVRYLVFIYNYYVNVFESIYALCKYISKFIVAHRIYKELKLFPKS
jgi:hypothetical protein